ncbi:hypothetical protein [Cryptosporangium sp. NPDC051539]|uniref:hypothetical protein n=1 Tax=Cryptosporangium sp. NPDC051539 TaxID=3363962 RepID=UPI0037B7884A
MVHHALDRHALEPPMSRPFAAVARHRPGLVALLALVVPVAAWARDPLLALSGLLLAALFVVRVRLAADEIRRGAGSRGARENEVRA